MPRGSFDRSARRARTRAQLLDAAARTYSASGIEGATLDEVAERAGYTKGAVYDHFGSKDNLLFALLDEYLAAQIAEQVGIFEAHRELPDRARGGADRWLAHLREDPGAFRLFVEAWVRGQRDEGVRARVVAAIEPLREMFRGFGRERAAELGESRSQPVLDGAAELMAALGIGFAMLELTDPERVSSGLLGAGYLMLIGALEGSAEIRALIEQASVQRGASSDSSVRLRSSPPA